MTASADMTLSEAVEELTTCFGRDGGWWHEHNKDTFQALFVELVENKLSYRQAVDILAGAYAATADEYGS